MNTLVQRRVPADVQGRVYGVQMSLFYAAPPVAFLITGLERRDVRRAGDLPRTRRRARRHLVGGPVRPQHPRHRQLGSGHASNRAPSGGCCRPHSCWSRRAGDPRSRRSAGLPDDATVTYAFTDSSVPPQYHRSVTLTVTRDEAHIVVDSYGDVLADERVATPRVRVGDPRLDAPGGRGPDGGGSGGGLHGRHGVCDSRSQTPAGPLRRSRPPVLRGIERGPSRSRSTSWIAPARDLFPADRRAGPGGRVTDRGFSFDVEHSLASGPGRAGRHPHPARRHPHAGLHAGRHQGHRQGGAARDHAGARRPGGPGQRLPPVPAAGRRRRRRGGRAGAPS